VQEKPRQTVTRGGRKFYVEEEYQKICEDNEEVYQDERRRHNNEEDVPRFRIGALVKENGQGNNQEQKYYVKVKKSKNSERMPKIPAKLLEDIP
jgi:hypothetical protein